MKLHQSRFSLIQRIAFYVLAGFWFTLLVLGLIVYNQVGADFREQMEERLRSDLNQFQAQIVREADNAYAKAILFSRDERVREAYELAFPEGLGDEASYTAARNHLRELFGGTLAAFKEEDLGRLAYHFHLPDARSLWRVWRANQEESDDLSGFRETVLAINRPPHRPIKGIEVGRGGFAIRGMASVVSREGGHLGSVEYLGDFASVYEALTVEEGQEAALFMKRELLPIATSLQDSSEHPPVGAGHILVSSSYPEYFRGVMDASLLSGVNGNTIVDAEAYLLGLSIIPDFSGNAVGVLVVAASKDRLEALQSSLLWLLAGAFVLGSLLIGVVMWVIYRPLQTVSRLSDELAQGAAQIKEASGEVSTSSQTLADGASQQAAAVEEASAALEDVNQMMQKDAALAKGTRETATKAVGSVEKGETAMETLRQQVNSVEQSTGKMQAAMRAILESSNSISKIVRTIDEIAFQTNILALNAAVEAARAGEAGEGFAVVADEVRSLARRAAEAASETTGIIDDSKGRSQEGLAVNEQVVDHIREVLECVKGVGEELAHISSQVREVGTNMEGLETSVVGQSGRVGEINTAITQVNDVTQENAASAEEAASSSEELNAQAELLNEISDSLSTLILGAGAERGKEGSGRQERS